MCVAAPTFSNVRGGAMLLNTGFSIPLVGLGTYKIRGEDVPKAVEGALAAGYRMFDTAKYYLNEKELGDALAQLLPKFGLTRQDIFLTTKFFPEPENNTEGARRLVTESLENLRTDYLDLVLIHYPKASESENNDPINPINRRDAYVELEKLKKEGVIRSVGVSNYEKRHLEEIVAYQESAPAVNQMEFHPHFTRPEAKEYCDKNGIFFQAFSSLARHEPKLVEDPVVMNIAKTHNTSVELVLLAFALCQKVGIVPKSTNPERIAANMSVVDIKLSASEVEALNSLNQNQHYIRCTGWEVL
uniref:Aldo_ket_red domain-containing protein n=1 Tax=Steinernema glaseri TaxID=37863 RepID=A0A1I7YAT9_9BILA